MPKDAPYSARRASLRFADTYGTLALSPTRHDMVTTSMHLERRPRYLLEDSEKGDHVNQMEDAGELAPQDPMKSIMNHLGGYHRCYLSDPIHLEFVSDNLCNMLGYTKSELGELIGCAYTALMHPDDTGIFDSFVLRLAKRESCESVAYRLIKKDGSVIRVVDTMASVRGNDGAMRGYSVVCEIPDEKVVPGSASHDEKVAVMRVSGGLDAIITQACGTTQQLLGTSGDPSGLSLMDFVSMADREKVSRAIARAYGQEYSGMESCTIVSAKGEGVKCDLWIELVDCGDGIDGSSFCVKAEIDQDYQHDDEGMASFSKMLFSSFAEDVFEVDRLENSVKYICHSDRAPIKAPLNVRMNADDFLAWFLEFVSPDDRAAVRRFCLETKSLKVDSNRESLAPSKVKFAMTEESGFGQSVALVMVPVSCAKYFLCLNSEFTAMGSGFCSTAVADRKKITARLFGSFSLQVDDDAVHIRSEKGRELLALMIEKRGAYLTTREAIASLWECEPDEKTRARYRKIASRLMAELKSVGIDYIVESDRGARRIIPEFIECDYYDYRDGLIQPSGDLLPEYSWAEYVRVD